MPSIPVDVQRAADRLLAQLGEETNRRKNSRGPISKPELLFENVEAFLHAADALPGFPAELERRAVFVQSMCRPGSAYDETRDGCPVIQGLPSAQIMLDTGHLKEEMEALRHLFARNLPHESHDHLVRWSNELKAIRLEADRIQADGCRWLKVIKENNPMRAILKSSTGGSQLLSIKDAVVSLIAWEHGRGTEAKSESSSQVAGKSDDELVTLDSLAAQYKLSPEGKERLRGRLRTWMRKHPQDFQEVEKAKSRQSRYLFRFGSVKAIAKSIAESTQKTRR